MIAEVRRVDVTVLGAGILGCSLSYYLAARGLKVVTIERSSVGSGATRLSGGILSFQGWDPWDLQLVQESAGDYRQISESEGRSP